MKIRLGIVGYGNLGRGVEYAASCAEDMELCAVFTRRAPDEVKTMTGVPVYRMEAAQDMRENLDVLILCGGSAKDLPEQTPFFAERFHVVDSFDTHAKIPGHFEHVDAASRAGGKVSIISAGWDPGLFSLNRLLGRSILPDGADYTFWGKGVSQGHSDAIRRIDGVLNAKQYTVPVGEALARVRNGENPVLSTREKHTRECFVVAKEGADFAEIERKIKTMPDYFADYDTTVHFISEEELLRDHAGIPHGGSVIRSGKTGGGAHHVMEFSLKLDSNPEFTGSILLAYARAAVRLSREGKTGCNTVFDVPFAYLYPGTPEEMRKNLL